MWNTFSTDNNIYILKYKNNNEVYKIYLSDFKEFWCDEYSTEEIVKIFQECNPTVVKTNETVSQVLKFFSEIDKAEVTIINSGDKIDVHIKTRILDLNDTNFNFKYKFTLIRADQNMFTEEITVPMIHTIHHLEQQQKILCNLIEKKDRELEEYKMEKGIISRTDLITEKFYSNTVGNSSEKLMLNVYNQSTKFWDNFVKVHGDIEVQAVDVKENSLSDVKKKRKIYNSITAAKKTCETISYKNK